MLVDDMPTILDTRVPFWCDTCRAATTEEEVTRIRGEAAAHLFVAQAIEDAAAAVEAAAASAVAAPVRQERRPSIPDEEDRNAILDEQIQRLIAETNIPELVGKAYNPAVVTKANIQFINQIMDRLLAAFCREKTDLEKNVMLNKLFNVMNCLQVPIQREFQNDDDDQEEEGEIGQEEMQEQVKAAEDMRPD